MERLTANFLPLSASIPFGEVVGPGVICALTLLGKTMLTHRYNL